MNIKKIKLMPVDPYSLDTLYDIPAVMKRAKASSALMCLFLVIVTCLPTTLVLLFLWVASMDAIDYTFIILLTAFLSFFCVIVGAVARELRRLDE